MAKLATHLLNKLTKAQKKLNYRLPINFLVIHLIEIDSYELLQQGGGEKKFSIPSR
jgi:hypothetical protein